MEDVVTIIQQLGFPIAAAIGLGIFIYKLIMKIINGMETIGSAERSCDKEEMKWNDIEEKYETIKVFGISKWFNYKGYTYIIE